MIGGGVARRQQQRVDLRDFGVVGNGNDDTTAFNTGYSQLSAAGGGTLWVPPGSYSTGTIEMKNHVVLEGAGRPMFSEFGDGGSFVSKITLAAGTDASLLHAATGQMGMVVRGLALDGNKANNSGTSHVVEFKSASANATITTSAAAGNTIETTAAHLLVEGDVIRFSSLTGGSGLSTGTNYYVIATNLTATTFMVSLSQGGAPVDFTTDITAGTVSNINATNHSATNAIEDCYILNAQTDGVHIGVGYVGTRVTNCWIMYSGQDGISVGASDCLVSRCSIGQTGRYGVWLRSGQAKVETCDIFQSQVNVALVTDGYGYLTAPRDNMVSQCVIQYAAEDGLRIGASATMNSVVGCLFDRNSYGADWSGDPGTAEYQVYSHIASASTLPNTAVGNTFSDTSASKPHCRYDIALGATGTLHSTGNVTSGAGASYLTAHTDQPDQLSARVGAYLTGSGAAFPV